MRTDGYAPIEDYAVIGDGRTAALVAKDGSIDWLCLPNLDSASTFAAILDTGRGGSFSVNPAIPFQSTRRYLPRTNVPETTFTTEQGSVRLLDAMTLPNDRLDPMRELVRSLEGVSGRVPMRWRCAPRFDYGQSRLRCDWRYGVPLMLSGNEAIALISWGTGSPVFRDAGAEAEFELGAGERGLIAMTSALAEPLVFPGRKDVEARLRQTISFWRTGRGRTTIRGRAPIWCCAARLR